jgi:hypothetical protein
MRWTRATSPDECRCRRTAKARGPDPPTLGSSPARRFAGRRWLKSPVPRGERADRPLTPIAQGRPECFGGPVVTNACAFYPCTRGYGCAKHPAFPAPSDFEGHARCRTRADRAARMLTCIPSAVVPRLAASAKATARPEIARPPKPWCRRDRGTQYSRGFSAQAPAASGILDRLVPPTPRLRRGPELARLAEALAKAASRAMTAFEATEMLRLTPTPRFPPSQNPLW